MRFDWYQPTIAENPVVIAETLRDRLAPGGEITEGRGKHGYRQSLTVHDARRERVAMILCGGKNGDPNVTTSGQACDGAVPTIRELWPEHRVTCAHVAQDFEGEGSWEALEPVFQAVKARYRLRGRLIADDDPRYGKTRYAGAMASDVSARLYDKTAELRRHLPPERQAEIPDHVTRLEFMLRPRERVVREIAAHMEPEHFLGMSKWTAALAAEALALEVQRVTMQHRRETDHDRAVRYLVEQYGPTLNRMLLDHGDWQAVGMQLGHLIRERELRN